MKIYLKIIITIVGNSIKVSTATYWLAVCKPFIGRAVNDPVYEEVFWKKNGGAKDFDFKQENSIWKKRGSSRVEGSGLQLGVLAYFFDPLRNSILCPLF